MNDKSKPTVFSRRGFIKGIGSGVVGSYMAVPALSMISRKVIDEIENESTNKEPLTLKINGKKVSVLVEPRTTLAELLRNRLKLTGTEITTIEGLLSKGKLHPIQEAFAEHDGMQCGFCTPGQIMSAQAILIKNPKPSKEEILDGMSGNLCRCAAYPNILKSVVAAAGKNK